MRKLILASTLALGLGALAGPASAAPGFAPQPEMAAMSDIEQVRDHRGHHYGRQHWRGQRYGHGRHWGGPPPHARAYGHRRHHYGYYGRDRQWDRTW